MRHFKINGYGMTVPAFPQDMNELARRADECLIWEMLDGFFDACRKNPGRAREVAYDLLRQGREMAEAGKSA